MAVASIPVDLLNPGQVFGCIGLLELAELLIGGSSGAFDWSHPEDTRFRLSVGGNEDPIAAGLKFLAEAEVHAIRPTVSELDTSKWNVPCRAIAAGEPFPIPPPSSPATLPAVLTARGHSLAVSSWGEGNLPQAVTSRRDNVKFWAGSGGYPGVALQDALELVRGQIAEAGANPFSVSAPQTSSFRFDWRRDYIPIDIGFSLNAHETIQPQGYPLVEILAAIGLAHARPQRRSKLEYRYGVLSLPPDGPAPDGDLLAPPFLRAGLGGAPLPFPSRIFTMNLGLARKGRTGPVHHHRFQENA